MKVSGLGKAARDEILGDLVVFVAGEQDAVGSVNGPACSPDLLVVTDDRPRSLKVDDKAEVRFVEPHPERDRRYQCFQLIVAQSIFQFHSSLSVEISGIRFRLVATRLKPSSHPLRIGDRQAVNDAAAWKLVEMSGQPGESVRDTANCQSLKTQRFPIQ